MYGWWTAMGHVADCMALALMVRHRRRRAERVRLNRIRDAVDRSLSALKQPDGSPTSCSDRGVAPPTFASVAASPAGSAVRCRRRVVLSASSLSTTLGPGWRFQ